MWRMFYEACYDEMFIWRSFKVYNIMFSQIINMIMVCLKINIFYDHDACHLINQVITKDKTVSYHPFSLCRPKDIKETV